MAPPAQNASSIATAVRSVRTRAENRGKLVRVNGDEWGGMLTHEERDEVKRLIDLGEPVLDKYRWKLFAEPRETELIWPGKTNEVTNVVLPFQTIEQIDEPRAEKEEKVADLFELGAQGRQSGGWVNKLIWGDNKLVLASLKNGPLRRQIEDAGGLKLVYIDPPFDVGADFSVEIEIGEETLTKQPSVIEDVAYRDTWGRGADSYSAMIYERVKIIHVLMASDSSIYIHCDGRVNSLIREVLDELFGVDCYANEIVWKRTGARSGSNQFNIISDRILFYKRGDPLFITQYVPYDKNYLDAFLKKMRMGGIFNPLL